MIQDIQYIKTKANLIRHIYIEDMEKYLLSFDQKVTQRGIVTEWVENEEDLSTIIQQSFLKKSFNKICFDSSVIPSFFTEKNQLFKIVIAKQIKAMRRFVRGPAIPTRAAPQSPPLTLSGRNGTGFAPPKIGMPNIASKNGKMIVMNGSICAIGFKVRRPSFFAVESPSQYAITPCISSCRTMLANTTAKTIAT